MARIDSVIERLFRDSAIEMLFETGAGIRVRTGQGFTPVVKQALTTQQIIGAFAEIVPVEQKADFPPEGATEFDYIAPAGAVTIRFERTNDVVRAVVTPEVARVPEVKPTAPPSYERRPGARTTINPPPRPLAAVPPPAPTPSAAKIRAPGRAGDASSMMNQLLQTMLEAGASDLHLSSENFPMMRLDGDIAVIEGFGRLSPDHLKEMIWSIAPQKNRDQWS